MREKEEREGEKEEVVIFFLGYKREKRKFLCLLLLVC